MSWFNVASLRAAGRLLVCAGTIGLAACTVEPLAGNRVSLGNGSTIALSQAVSVDPVSTRVEQQLRNELLFAMHGGNPPVSAPYRVRINATATDNVVAIRGSTLAPTAANVTLNSSYQLIEVASGRVVDSGSNTALAAYDRTSQSFANDRARRDAENRAAKEAARRISLAISRALVAS
jgi:LPS-assembly lipoprotein